MFDYDYNCYEDNNEPSSWRGRSWFRPNNMDRMYNMDMDRSRSWGRMDGRMDNMKWNMNRNMDGMDRLNRMDRMDRMDMNWMEGRRNERQMRSRSNSVRRTHPTKFDY